MESNYIDVLEVLLSSSAADKETLSVCRNGIDVKDAISENSLLHYMVCNDLTTKVAFLLSAGANPNTKNKNGETPLHWAAIRNNLKSAALLLKGEADLNASDNSGSTALHCAVEAGHSDMVVTLLLNQNCAAAAVDKDGFTALSIARTLLLTANADDKNNFVAMVAFIQRHDTAKILPLKGYRSHKPTGNRDTGNIAEISEKEVIAVHHQSISKANKDFVVRAIEYDITQTIPIFTPLDTTIRRPLSPSRKPPRSSSPSKEIFAKKDHINEDVKKELMKIKNDVNDEVIKTKNDLNKLAVIDVHAVLTPLSALSTLRPHTAPQFASSVSEIILPTRSASRPNSRNLSRLKNNKQKILKSPETQAHDNISNFASVDKDTVATIPIHITTANLYEIWDCLVAVEYCWDCSTHNLSLRHDENRYDLQADLCIEMIADLLISYRIPVRLFACKVK